MLLFYFVFVSFQSLPFAFALVIYGSCFSPSFAAGVVMEPSQRCSGRALIGFSLIGPPFSAFLPRPRADRELSAFMLKLLFVPYRRCTRR